MRRAAIFPLTALLPLFVLLSCQESPQGVTDTGSLELAANPHFQGAVRCTEGTDTVTCTGTIAGLGNQNISVLVSATGTASVECTNPGGNVAPGQDTTINASGQQTNIEVKNGKATFSVTTSPPPNPSGGSACPNASWTADIVSVNFTSVTVSVFQPSGSGNLVLQRTFSL